MVVCIISKFDRDAYILIDLESTHSYMSKRFSLHADRSIEPLECSLMVATPLGKSLVASYILKDCVVLVEDQELEENLISLDLKDFDAILSME